AGCESEGKVQEGSGRGDGLAARPPGAFPGPGASSRSPRCRDLPPAGRRGGGPLSGGAARGAEGLSGGARIGPERIEADSQGGAAAAVVHGSVRLPTGS